MKDKIKKFCKRSKRPFAVWLVVVVLCGIVGAVVSNASYGVNMDDYTIGRSSANVQSVVVGFGTYYEQSPSFVFDFGRVFDEGNTTYNATARTENMLDADGKVVRYECDLFCSSQVIAEKSASKQRALDFKFGVYRVVNNDPSTRTKIDAFVNFIEFIYGANEVHVNEGTWKYANSGVGSPYIIGAQTSNAVVVDVHFEARYRTWKYYSYNDHYSNIRTIRHTYDQTHEGLDLRGGIGCYRDYNEFSEQKNEIYRYIDGALQGGEMSYQYKYIMVDEAKFTAYFDTAYSTDLVISYIDWFDEANENINEYRLPPYLDRYLSLGSEFTVGNFLRESVNAFLRIEIFPSFSLNDMMWLIMGLVGVIAIVKIFH